MTLLLLCMQVSVAQDEASFQKPKDTETSKTRPLGPEETASTFQLESGFRMSVFAAEPQVRQPIAMTTDERGRLWVVENYTYAEQPVNFDVTQRDRILIFEDTDRDGVADKRTVFWDDGERLTSIALGNGGVWATCAPNLIFLPDQDGDDQVDGDPIVVLDGWDAGSVRHNIVNGLRWGPDGWLYGRHGILATSRVGRPGALDSQRTPINCGIWRYHPRRDQFEVVCTGTTNPWGMDWDAEGELFFINTVIGHLWHAVPGSHFERMYGGDFNPYWYELLPQIADHVHWNTEENWSDIRNEFTEATDRAGGGHAHSGLLIYQEGVWPNEYQGEAFTLNLHGRRINREKLHRKGASFLATHEPDFAMAQDPWFRGIELIPGPDGSVWICDWSDTGECHENDGVHRSSGRIYRLAYEGDTTKQAEQRLGRDFTALRFSNTKQLLSLALDGREWWSRQARRQLVNLLVNRESESIEGAHSTEPETGLSKSSEVVSLWQVVNDSDQETQRRLRALWCLASIDCFEVDKGLELLEDTEPAIRRWSVRLLADRVIRDERVPRALTELAHRESDGLVLMHLASSLNRLSEASRWDLATTLVKKDLASQDTRLAKMVWYGLEPAVSRDPAAAVSWLERVKPTAVTNWVARRLMAVEAEKPRSVLPQLVENVSLEQGENSKALVLGLAEGAKGLSQLAKPGGWDSWISGSVHADSPEVRLAIAELESLFDGGRGADALIAVAKDSAVDLAIRKQALQGLGRLSDPAGRKLLLGLIRDRDLGNAALRALRFDRSPEIAKTIISQISKLRRDDLPVAIATLTSRRQSARQLVDAVEEDIVNRESITSYDQRQLLAVADETLLKRVAAIWPEASEWRDLEAEKQRVRTLLASSDSDSRDLSQGAELFKRQCASCHRLVGQGGEIGPDLTGGQRTNLEYLVSNIVDPSEEVAVDFRTSLFELEDGQVVVGVVLNQSATRVEVQTKEEVIVIPRGSIVDRVEQGQSLMPNGLLNGLTDDEVLDLFAYLQQAGNAESP